MYADLSDSAGSMVLVWRGGPLHLLADRRPHFVGWQTFIQQRSGAGDQPLSQQQLTDLGVPVIIDRCLDHVTRYGIQTHIPITNENTKHSVVDI